MIQTIIVRVIILLDAVAGKKFPAESEKKQMQRRIQHLERINESLRKDLKHQQFYYDPKNNIEKTDVSIATGFNFGILVHEFNWLVVFCFVFFSDGENPRKNKIAQFIE